MSTGTLARTNGQVMKQDIKEEPFGGLPRDRVEFIKKTVAIGHTDMELELFLYQCRKTGLDPLNRQIYSIKRGDKATIQVGIDGLRLVADRTGNYAGNDEPVFTYDDNNHLHSASVTVWKFVQGQHRPFSHVCLYSEYVQVYNGKPSQMWEKMPHQMLAKCAEAGALRKAFPADTNGLYVFEEMGQSENAPKPSQQTQQAQPVEEYDPVGAAWGEFYKILSENGIKAGDNAAIGGVMKSINPLLPDTQRKKKDPATWTAEEVTVAIDEVIKHFAIPEAG